MPENWQQLTWKVGGAIIIGLAVTISAMGFSMRDDGKEFDALQTQNIADNQIRINEIAERQAGMEAKFEATMIAIQKSLERIESDLKEIKDKR